MSDGSVDVTFYRNATNPLPWIVSPVQWHELGEILRDCSTHDWQSDPQSKLQRHAFTLAKTDGNRGNANVVHLSGICADVDIDPDDPLYAPFPAMVKRLRGMGVGAIIYTTTKSSAAAHRYRIVMRFEVPVLPQFYRAAWDTVNARLGGIMDASTHDPARLMFTPARWRGVPDAYQAFEVVEGNPVLTAADISCLPCGVTSADIGTSRTTRTTRPRRATSHATPPSLTAEELDEMAHGKRFDWSGWRTLTDIDRSPLVGRWVREELPNLPGSRDYKFAKAVVRAAQRKSYPISPAAVAALIERWSRRYLDREPMNPLTQAQHALAWCYRNPPV